MRHFLSAAANERILHFADTVSERRRALDVKLNSHGEWSPLRKVAAGSAVNDTSHERELSFGLFRHDNLTRPEWYYPPCPRGGSAVGGPTEPPTPCLAPDTGILSTVQLITWL